MNLNTKNILCILYAFMDIYGFNIIIFIEIYTST